MAKVADLLVKIGADIDGFTGAVKNMQNQLKDMGKKFTDVGNQMSLGLTLPITGAATAIVKTTADFESSMNKVKAISGATEDQFKQLEKQAMELGAATVFSASEAADGMTFLAMAGFEVNEIMDAMPGLLDLAAASGMGLADSADIASNIMSGFAIEAKNATKVADVLALAAASANTDVYQLGDAMKYAAPIANALGLTMEETAAAVGFMSDAGIQGSMAGTALRAGLTRLANPSKQARELMMDLGIEIFDSSGKMKSLSEVIKILNSGMAGLTEEEKAAAAATIFGQEALSGWLAVMGRGDEELSEFVKKLEESEGAAKLMADTMNSGLMGAWHELEGATETLAITLGQLLAPMILKVAEALTELVRWFTGLSSETQMIIMVMAGLVAAIGPVLVVIGTLMTVLGSLTAPIVAIVVAVTSLIAIFSVLIVTNEHFREVVMVVWQSIKDFIVSVVNGIISFIRTAFDMIQALWETHGDTIVQATIIAFNFIKDTISTVLSIVSEIISSIWKNVSDLWKKHGDDILNATKTAFDSIMSIIKSVLDTAMSTIDTIWKTIVEFWKKHGDTILNSTMTILTSIWNFIQTTLDIIKSVWESHGKSIWETIVTTFQNIFNTITTILTFVWEFISDILLFISEIWSEHGEWIMTFIFDVFTDIFNTIMGVLNSVIEFVGDVLAQLQEFWNTHGDNIMKIVEFAFNRIMEIVKYALPWIQSIFTSVFGAVKAVVQTAWDVITSIFKGSTDVVMGIVGVFSGLLTGDFKKAFDGLKQIVSGVWEAIKGLFRGGVNFVIRTMNGMISGLNKIRFDVPDWVPVIGGMKWGFNIPKIPELATGGIATGPTLAWVGEGAEDEAILPLSKLQSLIDMNRGGDGSTVVIVELDGRQIARGTLPHFEREIRLKTGLTI